MSSEEPDAVSLSVAHHGVQHEFTFAVDGTITDLSTEVESVLSIPSTNQKFLVAKLGLLKPPFKDPHLLLSSIADKKITLMGSTAAEVSEIGQASAETAQRATLASRRPKQKVTAYKTRDSRKEQEESQYTFTTLRPLPYLPNPSRSLDFLQRLKDDAGIKTAMRKHKFTVPLLTEMNPVEHTTSNHEGTSRTLGLNRNRGEVIELRLRTDAYDGYRDYKTIRKTLCHELAHNVHSPHDRNFWDLCHQIEREVEKADWKSGGQSVGNDVYEYAPGPEYDEEHDDGGWNGGEFVLGANPTTPSTSGPNAPSSQAQGLSRREILAKAAEERMKKVREENRDDRNSD